MFCSVEANTNGGLTEDDLTLLHSPGIIEHFHWVYLESVGPRRVVLSLKFWRQLLYDLSCNESK